MNIYEASFRRLLAQIEQQGHYLSHSTLREGVWTVTIHPKPLCVFRVRYHASSRQLVVSRRRPFFYRELLRRTLDAESLEETIRDVVGLIGPARSAPAYAAPPPPKIKKPEAGWPELKQFGELAEDDFLRHPVWINCHVEDYEQPWYDQTDEETFRPWSGPLPVAASQGMFLVRAMADSPDGPRYPGFLTPAFEEGDLGMMQPHVFVKGKQHGFWGGGTGVPIGWRQAFYESAGKEPEEIFPLRFRADAGLAEGVAACEVAGFYWLQGKQTVVER